MNRAQLQKIEDYLQKQVYPLGYEIIECEWSLAPNTLRVFIDKNKDAARSSAAEEGSAEGGVLISDCAKVNKILVEDSHLEDLVGVGDGKFQLEISSPGVYRPLRKAEHFLEYLGHTVKVKLYAAHENRKNGTGTVQSVANEQVTLETEIGEWKFPLADLKSARLEVDL